LNVTANRLLAALPGSALSVIDHYFTCVSLATGTIVYEVGEEIDQVYFPSSGVASLQTVMKDGRAIDTSLVGRDGAVRRPINHYRIQNFRGRIQARGRPGSSSPDARDSLSGRAGFADAG
jgi:hypothetical protein